MDKLATYDPNIRWAKQRVRLTLMQWEFQATLETEVGGNCQGFEIFETAINNAWEALPTRTYAGLPQPVSHVILTRADGETLECEDDEDRCEDWLREMIVSMEIIAQAPEKPASIGAQMGDSNG